MLDDGDQPIVWTRQTIVPARDAMAQYQLMPVVIPPGSLGSGVPDRAVSLSRQHRILVQGRVAEWMFGTSEVLVAAIHFEQATLASIAEPTGEVRRLHLLLPRQSKAKTLAASKEAKRMILIRLVLTGAKYDGLVPALRAMACQAKCMQHDM